jgi:SAM-dependent methyltransferase
MADSFEATSSYWDSYLEQHLVDGTNANRAEWLTHPTVQHHHGLRRGNRSLEAWIADVALGGVPRSRGVGIGAGWAAIELGLLASDTIGRFDLLDVSAGAVGLAERGAAEMGLTHRITATTCDISSFDLGRARYDLVTCIGSLHHVTELNSVVQSCSQALTDDGVLVAYEYVGPDRFATGEVERELAQRLYRALDPALKNPCSELPLPNPEDVIAADPTEAVHSSSILDVLSSNFERVELVHHGGALAYTLWWGLAHDQLFESKEGWDFVEVLLQMDHALTSTGHIPDYFVTVAASQPVVR